MAKAFTSRDSAEPVIAVLRIVRAMRKTKDPRVNATVEKLEQLLTAALLDIRTSEPEPLRRPRRFGLQYAALLLVLAFAGCTTLGYKTPTGTSRYERTPYQQVQVLFAQPDPATYEQIGFVSVQGGAQFATPDTDMMRKLQKSAADLGADAVILRKETQADGPGGYWSAYSYAQSSGIAIKWRDPARRLPPLN